MTFQARSAAFASDDMQIFAEPLLMERQLRVAANDVADEPEAGWASRNPARAMALLFVNPRDCAMVDELMAL